VAVDPAVGVATEENSGVAVGESLSQLAAVARKKAMANGPARIMRRMLLHDS
jgi:hypothetical protein